MLIALAACSTSIEEYEATEPSFDIQTFFNGDLKGWGLVKDYRNKVNRRFTIDMKGQWTEDTGTLYELFKYTDGTLQERTWTLTTHSDGSISGIADDVTGRALGQVKGFSFYWDYELTIQANNEDLQVHLQDWIYQIDRNAIINQAKIKKFGIPVGEVIVFILKQDTNS